MSLSNSSLISIAIVAGAVAWPAAAEDQDALVKRGAYLMNGPVACANCHTPRAKDFSFLPGMDFAGGFHIVDPAFDVYSAAKPDAGTAAVTASATSMHRTMRMRFDEPCSSVVPMMSIPFASVLREHPCTRDLAILDQS